VISVSRIPKPFLIEFITRSRELGHGAPDVVVGLLDGPVAMDHPDLANANVHEVPGATGGGCSQTNNAACLHGTFVAGILCARRGSSAPAICPGCTLLVCPIFKEIASSNGQMPSATPGSSRRQSSGASMQAREC
jgi:subtilisin family serine protease